MAEEKEELDLEKYWKKARNSIINLSMCDDSE